MSFTHAPTRSIVIIGGGFAGTVTALKLISRALEPLDITIIEPAPELGRGVAYSTSERVHLVNAPANHFSLYPDDPEHFSRWFERNAGDFPGEPGGFSETCAPRWLYGSYVGEELAHAVAAAAGHGVKFRHLRARAGDITRDGGRLAVVLEDGTAIAADETVLALGVFKARPHPGEAALTNHAHFVINPWDPAALDRIGDARDTLLIGISLSMVDVVASLESRGYKGRYTAISRRGHLVKARRGSLPERPDFLDGAPLPTTVVELLRRIRQELRAIEKEGGDWRSLLPALRANLSSLWQQATTVERLRFTRHLRSLWDVTLHQAAGASYIWTQNAKDEGRFSSAAGRLLGLTHDGERFAAHIRWRADGREKTVRFDAVVDCRGHQEHDWRRIDDPFVHRLLETGIVRPHATGYGIDATQNGTVIDRDGHVVPGLHAIGHPLRGVAWESSSIPEQLAQAIALAQQLLTDQATLVAAE